jgi:integrase
MPYQFKREPLLPEEATRLAQACQTVREKLVVWTLLDTGLRVSELADLSPGQIDWQGRRLTIYGKGGPAHTAVARSGASSRSRLVSSRSSRTTSRSMRRSV